MLVIGRMSICIDALLALLAGETTYGKTLKVALNRFRPRGNCVHVRSRKLGQRSSDDPEHRTDGSADPPGNRAGVLHVCRGGGPARHRAAGAVPGARLRQAGGLVWVWD